MAILLDHHISEILRVRRRNFAGVFAGDNLSPVRAYRKYRNKANISTGLTMYTLSYRIRKINVIYRCYISPQYLTAPLNTEQTWPATHCNPSKDANRVYLIQQFVPLPSWQRTSSHEQLSRLVDGRSPRPLLKTVERYS